MNVQPTDFNERDEVMSRNWKAFWIVVFLLCTAWFSLYAVAEVSEDAVISGKEVPDFTLTVLNTEEIVTKEQLSGKVYILEFWKTTCPKCQAKMELLHHLFSEFGKEGLEIISLSLDKSTEDIADYRKNNWLMPWKHVWLEDGWNHPMIKTFEVKRLPKLIIVGPDRRIIGTNSELDDEGIRQQIKEVFNQRK